MGKYGLEFVLSTANWHLFHGGSWGDLTPHQRQEIRSPPRPGQQPINQAAQHAFARFQTGHEPADRIVDYMTGPLMGLDQCGQYSSYWLDLACYMALWPDPLLENVGRAWLRNFVRFGLLHWAKGHGVRGLGLRFKRPWSRLTSSAVAILSGAYPDPHHGERWQRKITKAEGRCFRLANRVWDRWGPIPWDAFSPTFSLRFPVSYYRFGSGVTLSLMRRARSHDGLITASLIYPSGHWRYLGMTVPKMRNKPRADGKVWPHGLITTTWEKQRSVRSVGQYYANGRRLGQPRDWDVSMPVPPRSSGVEKMVIGQ